MIPAFVFFICAGIALMVLGFCGLAAHSDRRASTQNKEPLNQSKH